MSLRGICAALVLVALAAAAGAAAAAAAAGEPGCSGPCCWPLLVGSSEKSALEAPLGPHTYIVSSPSLGDRDEALRLLREHYDGSGRGAERGGGSEPPVFQVQRVMRALPYFTATLSRPTLLWMCGQPEVGPRIASVELDQAVHTLGA